MDITVFQAIALLSASFAAIAAGIWFFILIACVIKIAILANKTAQKIRLIFPFGRKNKRSL